MALCFLTSQTHRPWPSNASQKILHEHTQCSLDDAALERSNPEGNRLSTIQYTTNFIGVRLAEKESFSEQSLTNHG